MQSHALLVILDMNGTLLFRKARGGRAFVGRPRVNEFIQYLLAHHKVMVWSSAKPENVNGMSEKLFTKEERDQLVAIWARDTLRIPPKHYNSKVQCYKQLTWVWENEEVLQASKLGQGERWSQANTVLIDDSALKAVSEPHNLVEIEEFEDREDQKNTDVLGQVVQYLEKLKYETDVSAYMREQPFVYKPEQAFDWTL